MKIKFTGEYKSLKTFESDILDPFSVITGKNGSGKSQLIELIGLKLNKQLTPFGDFDFIPPINKIQLEGIENTNLSALNNTNWKTKVDQHLNQFRRLGKKTKLLGELFINNGTWFNRLTDDSIIKSITSISSAEVQEYVTNSINELEPHRLTGPTTYPYFQNEERLKKSNYFTEDHEKTFKIAIFVANYKGKKINDLVDIDFYLTPIPDYFLDEPKLFGSQLEFVFYNYAKRRDQNQRLFFDKVTYKEENDSISDDEFIQTFTPPWTLINKILEQHNLQFQFKGIERKDFSSDANISFPLIKTTVGKDIQFQFLSSGEKVIIGLIIKLFTSHYYNEKLEFPKLIVLDEPDAHLHPEMSKLLIDVLNGTFVQKLGIKVIIVTHSPSTVALCPDNSIYQLKNEPNTTLQKIEKNDALKLLTDFIPTLSIDYKNHKQVFVESPTDIKYYQMIFNKLNQERSYPFKLYFISNAHGKGSCQQVKTIVDEMREYGSTTVFGVIDWDLKNPSSIHVKVHGLNNRYNIENYLYDPIYLSILFMNLKAHGVYKELGIEETINQYSIGNESNEFLQKITDWFFGKYYEVYKTDDAVTSKYREVEYLNGRKIKMPTWFLDFSGHDFEIRLKKVFSALDKYTGEGQLQQEITTIVGKCYPFIPKDSELLIEEIINAS